MCQSYTNSIFGNIGQLLTSIRKSDWTAQLYLVQNLHWNRFNAVFWHPRLQFSIVYYEQDQTVMYMNIEEQPKYLH